MYIISIKIGDRMEIAPEVQEILTKYGKNINTRLGIRGKKDVFEGNIIIIYENENIEEFIKEFNKFDDIKINYMKI